MDHSECCVAVLKHVPSPMAHGTARNCSAPELYWIQQKVLMMLSIMVSYFWYFVMPLSEKGRHQVYSKNLNRSENSPWFIGWATIRGNRHCRGTKNIPETHLRAPPAASLIYLPNELNVLFKSYFNKYPADSEQNSPKATAAEPTVMHTLQQAKTGNLPSVI